MSVTYVDIDMTQMTCGKCGVPFSMPTSFYEQCKDHGDSFFCPHGHGRVFREPDVQRLTRELAEKDQQLAVELERTLFQRKRAEREERRTAAQKGIVTRLKNKAARGECPCCGRLFPDLAGHMAVEHPDFEGKQEPEESDES